MVCKISGLPARLLIRICVLLVLLIVGALLFATMEEDSEHELNHNDGSHKQGTPVKEHFMLNISAKHSLNVSRQKFSAIFRDIEVYIQKQKNRKEEGNHEAKEVLRGFMKWFYFCFISVTTIGYGDVYPRNAFSKLFLVPYCLFGIPLVFSILAMIGGALNSLHTKVIVKCYGSSRKVEQKIVQFYPLLTSSLVLTCFLLLGAALTSLQERWHFLDALYYWVTTCSTIGYGDLIANGEMGKWVDMIGWMLMRFLGLCLAASVVCACMTWMAHWENNEIDVVVKGKTEEEADVIDSGKIGV